ncbi:MAG TPA: hypothetical protein ACHBX0_13075 [Arsenophonus sp.]
METTITRKLNAKQIKARIRKGILLTSGRKVAKIIGVHESRGIHSSTASRDKTRIFKLALSGRLRIRLAEACGHCA